MMQHSSSELQTYPFLFDVKYKELIWGGDRIRQFKGLDPIPAKIGESWELCQVGGEESVLSNGSLAGKSLGELIEQFGARLLGHSVLQRYGGRFPLLVKLIDSEQNLSIQVHPDDDLAMRRHQSWGKTEMWYLIDAKPDAKIYVGWNEEMSPEAYTDALTQGTLVEKLASHQVQAGDVFYLPAGRVHAIGAGCLLAEIQQSSNITYRLYDYGRRDAEGKERELHTEQALEAIDYSSQSDYRSPFSFPGEPVQNLVQSPYFHTNLICIEHAMEQDLASRDSFSVYICLEGAVTLTDDRGHSLHLSQGQTALIAADACSIHFEAHGASKLLESYIETSA